MIEVYTYNKKRSYLNSVINSFVLLRTAHAYDISVSQKRTCIAIG